MSVQPLIIKPEISSSPTDFDGLNLTRALQISESKIGAEVKNYEV
jgi:hypothetical protein